jgi:CBS domain containing-hemolysin-like protein
MTRDVVTVTEDIDLGEVAALLEAKRIKRVPVTRDGKVIGIITRANLVRALASTKSTPPPQGEDDDRTIRARILAELSREEWAKVWPEDIIVRDRVVHFWLSSDEPEDKKQALRVAAETIPGVRAVEEHVVPAPVFPAF